MPPNTPRKPLIELPKDTELSKEQLRGLIDKNSFLNL